METLTEENDYNLLFNHHIYNNESTLQNTSSLLSSSTTPIETSQIIWSIIDGSLMFLILSGNILTICAVKLSRKLSRSISNQFVLSLALSDFLVGLTLPYHSAFYFGSLLSQHKYTCLLRFVLISMACSASIYNLSAIALDRYIAILYPLHYTRYMTKRMARFIISCGWIISSSISTLPIYWNRWDSSKRQECEFNIILPKYYVIFVLAPSFITIWTTLFVLYVRIWREAVQHAKRLRTTTNYYQNGFHQNKDWKSIQVVLLVLGCFSICWLPYLVVACFQVTEQPNQISDNLKTVYKATFSLAMANSSMNPLIYAWKNSAFRRAFIRLLKCQRPDWYEYNPSFRNNNFAHNTSLSSKRSSSAQNQITTLNVNHLQVPSIDYNNSSYLCKTSSCDLEKANSLKHIDSAITIIANENKENEESI